MSEWIEWKWTPEKPYPETLETRVWIKLDNVDTDEHTYPSMVKYWEWDDFELGNGKITHYRIAED